MLSYPLGLYLEANKSGVIRKLGSHIIRKLGSHRIQESQRVFNNCKDGVWRKIGSYSILDQRAGSNRKEGERGRGRINGVVPKLVEEGSHTHTPKEWKERGATLSRVEGTIAKVVR